MSYSARWVLRDCRSTMTGRRREVIGMRDLALPPVV
jgi:hypothetical protein